MRLSMLGVLGLAGCFDSLVSDPCAHGFSLQGGHCVAREASPDASTDGSPLPRPDAGTDAGTVDGPIQVTFDAQAADGPSCTADIQNDPDNCGACGVVCPSGACSNAMCLGALPGQIVAIGHDYAHHHAAMARVLGDAVALGVHYDIGVARWPGAASETAVTGTDAALAEGMLAVARPWHRVAMSPTPSVTALAGVDVVVVDAQQADGATLEATGTAWQATFAAFLARGGVIIVLEGVGTSSYRLASGAGLYTIAAPTDCTGSLASVTVGTDAVTQQVLSPYAAEGGSVALVGIAGAVIVDTAGDPVVAHLTR